MKLNVVSNGLRSQMNVVSIVCSPIKQMINKPNSVCQCLILMFNMRYIPYIFNNYET